MKKLAVIGSTGSIGQQTLDIVRNFPGFFEVVALAGGSNVSLLKNQLGEFHPRYVYFLNDHGVSLDLPSNCRYLSLRDMVALPEVDIVVMGISGIAGLGPSIAAARAGKRIALANKESLVVAGEIITAEVKKSKGMLLPVDSEHSAIWQCLRGESGAQRLLLTASGGPFLNYTGDELKRVTPEQALNHPSWKMGKKITVDSATLINKGLEVIEAHWLFGFPFQNIDILIHPQSIIHSMVEFVDGSIKAQLGFPDMRLPILYALAYPERLNNTFIRRIDWKTVGHLDFSLPNMERFPCLKLAIEAGKSGGTYPAVLCGADEMAVNLFLSGRIRFTDIPVLIEKVLQSHENINNPSIDDVEEAIKWAKEKTLKMVEIK